MDIGEIFSSVNKMSLLAFVIAIGFLVYEVRVLLKSKVKKEKLIIPSFDPSIGAQKSNLKTDKIIEPPKSAKSKPNQHIIISAILVIMVIFFGFISFSSMMNSSKTPSENQISLQEVQSSGIKIYDAQWHEITGEATNALAPGSTIYVGIATVKGSDIDEARIKINQKDWSVSDITSAYNKDNRKSVV